MRVLVAEDDPDARWLLQAFVEELGFEPLGAENGVEAWELFQSQGAEVLITDWRMPGLDGAELCRRVRAQVQRPYTYIIVLTALQQMEVRLTAMQAGADDYLTKPFSIDDLHACFIAAQRVTALHQQVALAHQQQTQLLQAQADRARLEGVLLAARTAAHHLNNQLSLTVGYGELLVTNPSLPDSLRPLALEAIKGARAATDTLTKLQQVARLEQVLWPLGLGADSPVLDLERSSGPYDPR